MKTLPHRQRLLPYWTHFKVSVGLNLLLAFHLRYRMNRENYCPWFGRSVVHSLTPIIANNTPQYKWSVKEQTSDRTKRKAKERLTVCLNWSISFVDWKMNSPLVLLRFFLIFGKEGILLHSQVDFFLFLEGKADTNVIKACALHMNERLKEVSSSEQRSVVVCCCCCRSIYV